MTITIDEQAVLNDAWEEFKKVADATAQARHEYAMALEQLEITKLQVKAVTASALADVDLHQY